MYRFALILLFTGFALSQRSAFAQDTEEGWKNLVMQALYAADQGQYSKAEGMLVSAVHEAERFGAQDARVGTTLNSLGLVYRAEKKGADAENAYKKSLAILEQSYGQESVDVANVNFNIANALVDQTKYSAAIPYLQKSLQSYETLLGGSSIKTASVLCVMGDAYRGLKEYPNAMVNLKRCADIREADGGIQNPELADALHSLALVYSAQGKFAQSEANFRLVEKIVERTSGIASLQLASTLDDHVGLLKQMGGREKDIERLNKMSGAIRRGGRRQEAVAG